MSDHTSIEKLEIQLAKLAYEWREAHSQNHDIQAKRAVKSYHEVIAKLWKLGWDGNELLPDSELPHEYMPDYFNKKWE